MVVLYIYIGTVALAFATDRLLDKYVAKEIENRGYEYKDKSKNIYKSIINFVENFIYCCIPLLNLLATGYFLFKAEEICDEIIKEGLSNDKLVSKKQEINVIESFEFNRDMNPNSKVVVYKIDDENKKEITREEKIEFLKYELSRLTGKDLTKEEKGKRRQKRR